MSFVLLTILLGILTYWVILRGVSTMTRSPVWLLWLIIMMPVLALTAWVLKYGRQTPPNLFVLALFLVCPLLYTWVVVLGRRSQPLPPLTWSLPKPRPVPQLLMQQDEEDRLRACFPWSVYFLQTIETRRQMLICRGRLKAEPAVAHSTVQQNVRSQFGNQFFVVLQSERDGSPIFTLVPNTSESAFQGISWSLSLLLFLLTLATTTLAGLLLVGDLSWSALREQPIILFKGLGYSLAVMMILTVRELAQYAMARYHGVPVTAPVFIPMPYFLGTMGSFVRLKAPAPNRCALFDLGVAGPLAGFLVTLPIVLWGLAHSQVVDLAEESGLFNFQSLDPRGSIMLALLSKLALGDGLQLDQGIYLHSVAIAGCLGLVLTALNLMPVGPLDGGHIVHAMYGRWGGAAIANIARILVAVMAFIQAGYVLWALLLIFMPSQDDPALDDVSELNGWRDVLGLVAMTVLVLIVLPMPQAISNRLF